MHLPDCMCLQRRLRIAIKKAVPCKRIGVAVIGLEVPHAHVHLVPMNSMGDLNFTRAKLSPSKTELEEVAKKIQQALSESPNTFR